ncbi:DUF7269 family protein [Haloplanus natans]|uniref:DUF7269 family protein n=1 Tax=Haloplanus natans TaxID=376171 RepID=UPI0006779962|nr:hypothetical protein [Haloplanus natans]
MSHLTLRRGGVGLALASVGFAVWYGYAPGSVPASIRTGVDRGLALVFAGAVAGVIGLLYSWLTEPDVTTPMSERKGAPSTPAVAGTDLSTYHERAVEDGPDDAARDPIRRRLRDVVVASVDGDAAASVDRGTWTDDRYAAAFLSTTADVDYPWYHRLYAWLYPGRAYDRRVRRALAATERAYEERSSGYEAPDVSSPRSRLRALRAALEGSS